VSPGGEEAGREGKKKDPVLALRSHASQKLGERRKKKSDNPRRISNACILFCRAGQKGGGGLKEKKNGMAMEVLAVFPFQDFLSSLREKRSGIKKRSSC